MPRPDIGDVRRRPVFPGMGLPIARRFSPYSAYSVSSHLGDCSTAARRRQIGPSLTFHPPTLTIPLPMGTMSYEALLVGIAYGNENALALLTRRQPGGL